MTPRSVKPGSKRVCLAGEQPLLGEFAELCSGRGMAVTVIGDAEGFREGGATAFAEVWFAAELSLIDKSAKRSRLRALASALPAHAPILTASSTVSTTEQASWIDSAARVVGISAIPSLVDAKLMEIAPSLQTSTSCITAVEDIFIQLGKEISVVQDRAGMVLPRIMCGLINEAFFAMMEGVAEGREIDTAMKLGTNYPRGPVEWANAIGLRNVIAILDAIRLETGEERYRAAPFLRRMEAGGEWWRADDKLVE